METIAVYWEERIKVYSISEKSGLALGILHVPENCADSVGDHICALQQSVGRFEMVTAHPGGQELPGALTVHLLLENKSFAALQEWVEKKLARECGISLKVNNKVELLYLHGPHFQDRYGIVDAAFSAFAENNCPLLLCGCTGTSMYLVVPHGTSGNSREILSKKFLLPAVA